MSEKDIITLCGLAIMSLAHILCSRENIVRVFEKQGWISFSAGASVSYVFIHVFPEIGIFQQRLTGASGHHQDVGFINQPLYLVALGGLCLLYLLDTIETSYQIEDQNGSQQQQKYMPLFYLRCSLYFVYNIMVAYIVTQRPGSGFFNITLITIALTMHFFVVNVSAKEKNGELFDRYIRWPATIGLLLGWALGILVDLPEIITVTVFSLIGGMITYIALKSELPQTRHKAPYHFFSGALIYALIVLAIPFFGHAPLGTH